MYRISLLGWGSEDREKIALTEGWFRLQGRRYRVSGFRVQAPNIRLHSQVEICMDFTFRDRSPKGETDERGIYSPKKGPVSRVDGTGNRQQATGNRQQCSIENSSEIDNHSRPESFRDRDHSHIIQPSPFSLLPFAFSLTTYYSTIHKNSQ